MSVLFKPFLISLILVLFGNQPDNEFKTAQKKYSRVRVAYAEKEQGVKDLLTEKELDINKINLYIRAFKTEKKLELWGKNKTDDKFKLIKIYDFCTSSGVLGPKRKQGDYQIPEGFYHIDRFNPYSVFYLSLGINYPNKSDRILGKKGSLGGDIFIHGDCVSIGCIPITTPKIKELYVMCVEAKNNGQQKIPVTIFPAKLNERNYKILTDRYSEDTDKINLWKALKDGYQYFEKEKKLPSVTFLNDGRYKVNSEC